MKAIFKHLVPNAGALVLVSLLLLAQGAGANPQSQPPQPQASTQRLISYQGTLTDPSGAPIDGTVTIEFALYDAASEGNLTWGPETQSVEVSQGLFHVLLGSVEPIDYALLTGDRWLSIVINGEPMTPREHIGSVVHAALADAIAGDLDMRGNQVTSVGRIDLETADSDWARIEGHGKGTFDDGGMDFDLGDDTGVNWRWTINGDEKMKLNGDGNLVVKGLFMNDWGVLNGIPGVILGYGSQVIIMPGGTGDMFVNWDRGSSVHFGGGNEVADVSIIPTGIDMHGNGVYNCGALTEANLQTPEELAAGSISRFEEGDVLCWGDSQLEKCATPNDPLVQAVADKSGRPIVIGAEVIKVTGPVKRGDYLITSDVPGHAKATHSPTFGTVIAQALEDFTGEKGLIKAMIRKM